MATIAKSDILARVKAVLSIPATPVIASDTDINSAITDALRTYNRESPGSATEDIVGDGGAYYDLSSVLDNWEDEVSTIDLVDYPAPTIADDDIPEPIEPFDEYAIVITEADGKLLYFRSVRPTSSQTIRITYTYHRTFDGSGDVTLHDTEQTALLYEAASQVCFLVAAYYAQETDIGNIGASEVGAGTKVDEWRRLGDGWHKKFVAQIKGDEGGSDAGIMMIDVDTQPSNPSGRYLFHRR